MESQTNQEIREVLEMYGIDVKSLGVKGDWNLIGHLVNVCKNHEKRELDRKLSLIKSF